MIFRHLSQALRAIKRGRGYSLINLAGLAVGMAASFLIFLWVIDELSFDRFHENHSRIHRVGVDLEAGSHMVVDMAMPALAGALRNEIPEVVDVARMSRPARAFVRSGDKEFFEDGVGFADNSLFEVFTFPLLAGDARTALTDAFTVVLSQDAAQKYFGQADPLGRFVRIDASDYVVRGVMANFPPNSHLKFRIVRSFETLYAQNRADMENWLNIQYYTYLLLEEGAKPGAVEGKLPALLDRHMGTVLKSMGGRLRMYLRPLDSIHLFARLPSDISPPGDISTVLLFVAIAVFVLLLACVNFINLTTARSAPRVLGIGVRKALGASRSSLLGQFLRESTLLSLAAFLAAWAIVESLRTPFESFIGRPLVATAKNMPWLIPAGIALAIAVGILAGAYPAFYLSSFRPARILRHGFAGPRPRAGFRNALVVFQFVASIVLLVGTITVYRQVHYLKNKDLGFDKTQVLVIPDVQSLVRRTSFDAVREELRRVPGVIDVGGSALAPTQGVQNAIFYPEGFTREQPQKYIRLDLEPHYLPTMGIEVVAGRNFSPDFPADPSSSLLVNETLAKTLGWTNPLGKTFTFWPPGGSSAEATDKTVVGVVKDFHYTSLKRKIEPLVLAYDLSRIRCLAIKIAPGNVASTLGSIRKMWATLSPERPFDYFFLDAAFARYYGAEERIGRLSSGFSFLAVFIGCLGLFGLASYVAESRTKEIGIRKVLGASSAGIVRMMTSEFLKLVLLANVLAWPIAYFALGVWLRGFPYRVNVDALSLFGAGLGALVTALLTVYLRAAAAARANPVEALRYE